MYKTTFFNINTTDTPLPTLEEYLATFNFNEILTQEMAIFSYKKALEHQNHVFSNICVFLSQQALKNYLLDEASLSEKEYEALKTELIKRGKNHDRSKLFDPERYPYLYINWKHHLEKERKIKYAYPEEMNEEKRKKAIYHHWKTNSHHPAFHYFRDDNTLEEDKGKITYLLKKMTLLDLLEMVADWMAVSQEYKTHCKEFAEDNVGHDKRWPFCEEQKTSIFAFIDILEQALQATHDLPYQKEESASIKLGK